MALTLCALPYPELEFHSGEDFVFPVDHLQQREMGLTSLVKFAVDTYSVVVVPVDTFSAVVVPAAAEQEQKIGRKLAQTVADVLFDCLQSLLHSSVHGQNFVDSSPLSTQMVQLNKHPKKKHSIPLGHQSHSGS